MNPESNQQSSSSNSKDSTEHSVAPPSYQQVAKQSQRWVWLLPLIVITLGIGLLAGRYWGEKRAEQMLMDAEGQQQVVTPPAVNAIGVVKAVEHKPVLTVEAISPQQSEIESSLSADGTIVPKNIATVHGKVSGVTLEQVLAEEGDVVQKGQILAVFDSQSIQQQQVQAQADLAEAQTQLELAENDVNRVLPLLEINAVSGQEADRYKAKAKQAAASVEAAQARLNSQNLNLNNAQVIAPVSGIISEKTANVGSVAGQAPLFTIIENGTLEWQAQVDPNQLGKVNVGTSVKVSLPKNKSVMGQVTRIAPVAEQGSRQVSIYATLENSPLVRAGMYQRGTFLLGSEDSQTLPVSAIVNEDGYDYVMLIEKETNAEDGTDVYRVKRKKVSLGERKGDRVVIQEPLSDSVMVVRQGGGFLNNGDIVRLAGESTSNTKVNSTTSATE